MKKLSSNNSTTTMLQSTSECKICGKPSKNTFFGAQSCGSCKTFFKRNAERGQKALKCHYNGNCEINQNSRHVCSYCRLMKCFKSGMEIEKLRSSRPAKKNTNKKKMVMDGIETTPRALVRLNEPEQLPILNLLRSDQSTLTIDQWNFLSHLSNCYDEHSGLSVGVCYMREQNNLPLKIRFKNETIMNLIHMTLNRSQSFYKYNQDFLSLSPDDRSVLLQNTFTYTGSFIHNCILHQIQLFDHPAYYHGIELLSALPVAPFAKRVAQKLNFDIIILKLFVGVLCFLTGTITVYTNTPSSNLSNIKQIVDIQNKYIELLWKYLLYKYNYKQAVICLSDLIRCSFTVHDGVMIAQDIQWYRDAVDSIVQDTKDILIIDD